MCGLCRKTIIPGLHNTLKLEFNGEVHSKCAEEFNKKSVLHQLKGIGQDDK